MSAADQAYEAALKEIARVKAAGEDELHFGREPFHALRSIPSEIASLKALKTLRLSFTHVRDIRPLAGLASLQTLWLNATLVRDLAPLTGLKALRELRLTATQVSDLAPLHHLTNIQLLDVDNAQVVDLRPIARLKKLENGLHSGLSFRDTPATKCDALLAELAYVENAQTRTRQTLAYLRRQQPWPKPYTPVATPDGSSPQPIGGDNVVAQAEALSDLTPLAEELVQNPETGRFSVQYKPIEKPDLLAATLGQVGDAIEDVLQDPSNGLNEKSLDIRKLKRTLERYANDPQRVEMDFTTVHQSLTRLIAIEELPPSDENLALLSALADGAQGIRATDAAVAVNRRILQEQKLRELPPEAIEKVKENAPILRAITEGVMQQQVVEDIQFLKEESPSTPPTLPGVTRDDAIMRGRDEAVRLFGRSSRMLIMLRKSPSLVNKLHQSTPYKAVEIMRALWEIVKIGLSIF